MRNTSALAAKISAYSTLASALIASKSAEGQIIYKNLKPDASINHTTAAFTLDLNGDGIADVTFQVKTRTSTGYLTRNEVYAFPGANASLVDVDYYQGVAALGLNTKIGSKLNVPNYFGANVDMGFAYSTEFGILYGSYGPWAQSEDVNHYVGIKIKKNGHNYYGWIRCRAHISLGGAGLTIKDYAFNATPDELIRAGQKSVTDVSDRDLIAEEAPSTQVFASEKMLHVNLVTNEFLNGQLYIYNLSGQNVYAQKIESTSTSVPLDGLESGIYVVSLISDDERKTFRVFVQ